MRRRAAVGIGGGLWALSVLLVLTGLWLRPGLGEGLAAMGRDWSLATATIPLSFATVGALIVVRRPGNVVGWALCILGSSTALASWSRYYATRALEDPGVLPGAEWVVWLFTWLIDANFWGFIVLVLLFPHGRLPTYRARLGFGLVVAAAIVWPVTTAMAPFDALAAEDFPFPGVDNPLAVLPSSAAHVLRELYGISLFAAQIGVVLTLLMRFRGSYGVERQQYKAFAYGALCVAATLAVGAVNVEFMGFAAAVGIPAIPVAAGVAVLRYRLYDIDRLLNRTLVYGLLSAALALVYATGVVLLQGLLRPLAGESQLAVAGSTLLVAALFGPLRRRVQAAVDRRFNRARYDAVHTIQEFRGRLRDDVDLDQLSGALLAAVGQTVQPARASLWLRPDRSGAGR